MTKKIEINDDLYYSPKFFGDLIDWSAKSVRRAIHAKKIKAIRTPGGDEKPGYRIKGSEIRRLLQEANPQREEEKDNGTGLSERKEIHPENQDKPE